MERGIVRNRNIAALDIAIMMVLCAAGTAPAAQTEQIQFSDTVFFPSGTNPASPPRESADETDIAIVNRAILD